MRREIYQEKPYFCPHIVSLGGEDEDLILGGFLQDMAGIIKTWPENIWGFQNNSHWLYQHYLLQSISNITINFNLMQKVEKEDKEKLSWDFYYAKKIYSQTRFSHRMQK